MTNQYLDSAETLISHNTFAEKSAPYKKRYDRTWNVWNIGACAGLLGGLMVLLGAIFLSTFEYFAGEKQHGTWLYFLVLPFMAFGAHCLDKLDAAEKARRIEACRRNGLRDADRTEYEYLN